MTDKEMNIKLFGEEDFEEKMKTTVEPWLLSTVEDGFFTTSDGAKLHFRCAVPENAKAAVIVIHGFCEFYGKYREMTYYLYNEGYAFFFLEQRGFGLSQRYFENKELVHIDSYDTYVRDQKEFIDTIVNERVPNLRRFILGHSMGGAIAALFLETYPGDVSAAVLCAPMIKMELKHVPPRVVDLFLSFNILRGKSKYPLQPKKVFDPIEKYPASGTLSPVRYHYLFEQRLADENYRTWSSTYGWARASVRATVKLRKHLREIHEDVLLFTDGREDRVDPKGFDLLIKKVPNITVLHFPESKHEVFNSTYEDRERFYKEVFTFFEEHSETVHLT